MSISPVIQQASPVTHGAVVQLENGERTDQKTFHAWYKDTPKGFKAELIGGEVVVASPLKVSHSQYHALIMWWLGQYWLETPGTNCRDNATAILGDESEPQPDGALVINPECGGQSSVDAEGYATGPPELVCEVANSSGAIDLHRKKLDYERAGVSEYVVALVRERQIHWFALTEGRFHDLPAEADGIYRSAVFPGLWLDAPALFQLDGKGLRSALNAGLASEQHVAFIAQLEARRKTPAS